MNNNNITLADLVKMLHPQTEDKLPEIIQLIKDNISSKRLETFWAGLREVEQTRDILYHHSADMIEQEEHFKIYRKTNESLNRKIGRELKKLNRPDLFDWLKADMRLTGYDRCQNVLMFAYLKDKLEA